MKKSLPIFAVLILLLPAGAAHGQVASALAVEGDPLPGSPPGQTVLSINNTAVNHTGGYAATINTFDGLATTSLAWGHATGGPGSVLFIEGVYGPYIQTSWESFFGISGSGAVGYSPLCTDTVSGTTGLDGVWVNDVKIMIEEDPYPNQPGMYWSFGSRPATTTDGTPYWVGGFTSTPGGATQNRGLFYGPAATPLLVGGGMVAGLPQPLTAAAPVSFDYRFSALGTHYIAEVQTATGSSVNDNHMAMDGAVALSDGSPISEASPVPAASGGLPGESWDNFDYTGITESGNWFFSGDTDAAVEFDEFVAIGGEIAYREGDTVDGEVLSGALEGAYMNENGDVAFIWDIQANTLEALFLNDVLLLKEGDEVDMDGDGLVDPGTALDNFTGISSLTAGDRDGNGDVNLYFTADISVPDSRGVSRPATVASDRPLDRSGLDATGIDETGLDETGRSSDSRLILEGFFVLTASTVTTSVTDGADGNNEESAPPAGGDRISIFPNPAPGGETTVRFAAPGNRPVSIDIYDIAGRHVRSIARDAWGIGTRTVVWDGLDREGKSVGAGTYFLRYTAGDTVLSRRITVIR